MISPHLLNIGVHVGAGTIAMAIGFWLLAAAKGTPSHRKRGRLFAWFTLAVCASAVVGNAVFRFMPLFAVLTVLVLYQLLSGWRAVYTKAAGPNQVDAMLGAGAAWWAISLVPLVLTNSTRESAPVVVYATLAALFALIAYDALRWLFPRAWHATLWRYEHIYKLVASLFSMLSAAAGNLFPQGQPWSQLLPSALGIAAIAWFFWRESRRTIVGQMQVAVAEA
ncbi:hypothetical protein HHL21_10180 [Massilia sp. RP-1-19]|uniref:DUF2306 domain-containing protein n=1 Tax=Massilia polaris TaxID=2728846 RepID=A0A848HK72_9BURK|nr:hypothetical protein [Massilia polaris]NML61437.1 hypothetical protein [Massilia polaris]